MPPLPNENGSEQSNDEQEVIYRTRQQINDQSTCTECLKAIPPTSPHCLNCGTPPGCAISKVYVIPDENSEENNTRLPRSPILRSPSATGSDRVHSSPSPSTKKKALAFRSHSEQSNGVPFERSSSKCELSHVPSFTRVKENTQHVQSQMN